MSTKFKGRGTMCLHCGAVCHAKLGKDVYTNPKSKELYGNNVLHVCPICPDSRVGSHPGTDEPLGFAANWETRNARSKLHDEMLDPIWLKANGVDRKRARGIIYAFLTYVMGLPERAHVGEFTIEQCREAWIALAGEDYRSISKFVEQMEKETI